MVTSFDAQLRNLKQALDSGATGEASSGVLDTERLLKQLHQIRREALRSLDSAEFKALMPQIRRLRARIRRMQRVSITSATAHIHDQQRVEAPAATRRVFAKPNQAFGNGIISGTVTDSGTSAGLASVVIQVWDSSGFFATDGETDDAGHYAASVAPGNYYVRTVNTLNYVDETYDNIQCDPGCDTQTGTLISVAADTTVEAIDFALDPTGSISGTVTDSLSGLPLHYAGVQVYDAGGKFASNSYTDESGSYTVGNLLPGTYFAEALAGYHANQLFDRLPCGDQCDPLTGTAISVTSGVTTGNINFPMVPWGRITGTVKDAVTGAAVAGQVHAHSNIDNPNDIYTDIDSEGNYDLSLPAATYYLRTDQSSDYIDQLYEGLDCDLDCDPSMGIAFPVTDGSITTGIDFLLQHGGSISGTVTDLMGAPLHDISIHVYTSAGYEPWYWKGWHSDSAGNYVANGLPAGTYFVMASSASYVDQLYDNFTCEPHCTPTAGTPVTVVARANVPGINFHLDIGGVISGIVKDSATNARLDSVYVILYDSEGHIITTTSTSRTGAYSFEGLGPGDYFVKAGGDSLRHIAELYNNIPCTGFACDPLTGTPVYVESHQVTTVDFALRLGGAITGRVTSSLNGQPLEETEVDIYDSSGYWVAYGYTNAAGVYISDAGLSAGVYYSATYTDEWLLDELYDNFPCLASECDPLRGTPIQVTVGSATSGIDFALGPGGIVTGHVLDSVTNAPIELSEVDIYNSTGDLNNYAYGYGYADTAGYYEVDLVPWGTSFVNAYDSDFNYVGEMYNNHICWPTCDPTIGDPVSVVEGGTTAGIDFYLDPGGSISGTVTSSAGPPPSNTYVYIYNSNAEWVSGARTDGAGNYSAPALLSGAYFALCSRSSYQDELYDNLPCPGGQCDILAGTPVSVVYGSDTPNINFILDPCASVTIDPAALPNGDTSTPYNQSLTVTGLSSPYRFSVGAGLLPLGLILSIDGHLSGTPIYPGTYRFAVSASDLNACQGARTYDVTITGCPVMTLRPTRLPEGAVGAAYSQTVVTDFGTPPMTFAVTSGALPDGISLSNSGLLSGIPTMEANSTFTITASDASGCSGSRKYNIDVETTRLFYDDFEDGVLDPNWTYTKSAWMERNGSLTGTSSGKRALAVADRAFSSGCRSCTLDVRWMTAGGSVNKVWILGWYENKRNTVELLVKEDSHRLVLKQRAGNQVVAKAKAAVDLVPNRFYTLTIGFDGNKFQVLIDGSSAIEMPKAAGTYPTGTVGFQVKNTSASFDFISVIQ